MGKIQPQAKAVERQSISLKEFTKWTLLSLIWVIVVFILYGTTTHYYPDPIPLAFGLYGDLGTAIVFAGFAMWTAIISYKIIISTKKRR